MEHTQNFDDVIEEHFPYDGPRSPQQTRAAANALGQLVRYLNNSTQYKTSLEYAYAVHNVLGGVNAAIYGLPQLFGQLRHFIEQQADDPTLYDIRRDRPARDTALELAAALRETAGAVSLLTGSIDRARDSSQYLANND